MSQQEFNEAAKESVYFAVFQAESYGVSAGMITAWLNAMRSAPAIVASNEAIAKHFGA